ncbi:hypothetical protein SBF1_2690011 [Candidatus Desulfosporosinus infrequens]|uniref:Uncharacterized protein n=1 Tax=Candidatus Desulfosporosinus infrequens TaxID=2043169 RepID=A0A2U3KTH8_9FIRM|nr:hypothetical protein SBF1_2690011 [Candidatus Desulfosporosinus infrequens]
MQKEIPYKDVEIQFRVKASQAMSLSRSIKSINMRRGNLQLLL